MTPRVSGIEGPEVTETVADAVHHACPITCYGPADLAKVYNFPAGIDGTGQTIVLVDAYGSPTIQADLATFDTYFQVPAPPSFTQIDVPGTGAIGSGSTMVWAEETSLDVEYAHAMAPGAKIVLAVAATDNNFDLNAAEAAVLPQYPGAIVSQSFGDFETDSTAGNSFAQLHAILVAATHAGDTLIASAGDSGATWTPETGSTSQALASYPASDPLVLAVGGTMGDPYPGGLEVNGAYGAESTWNEALVHGATGGAPSVLFRAPSYQRGDTGYSMRTIPDVAYNAAFLGGVDVLMTAGGRTHHFLLGGTSAGAPQWAAIMALANQARQAIGHDDLGFANNVLYKLAERQMHGNLKGGPVFHDITTGNNALFSTVGFAAGPGYDLTTGWGTPNVANLVAALVGPSANRNGEAIDPQSIGGGASTHGDGFMHPNV